MTLRELRTFIRNVLSPSISGREQIKKISKEPIELGSSSELRIDNTTVQPEENPLLAVISDPFVAQDRCASTVINPSYRSANLSRRS